MFCKENVRSKFVQKPIDLKIVLRFKEGVPMVDPGEVMKYSSCPMFILFMFSCSQGFIRFRFFTTVKSLNWLFLPLIAGAVDGWFFNPLKFKFGFGIDSFRLFSMRFLRFPTGTADVNTLLLSLIFDKYFFTFTTNDWMLHLIYDIL